MKTRDGQNCEIVGFGPLTKNFHCVRLENNKEYLVFTKTLKSENRYRMDDLDHPLDIMSE